MDYTPETIVAIATACAAIGATVTSTRKSAGWLSTCSWGTPYVNQDGTLHEGNIHAPGVRPEVDGFTLTVIRWKPGKGPTYAEFCHLSGLPDSGGFMTATRLQERVLSAEFWYHPAIVERASATGRGTCLVITTAERPGRSWSALGTTGPFLGLENGSVYWGLHG